MRSEQSHIKRIFESKNIPFEEVDVSDPHQRKEKQFMQQTLKLSDDDVMVALPPQIFKGESHRGVSEGLKRTAG